MADEKKTTPPAGGMVEKGTGADNQGTISCYGDTEIVRMKDQITLSVQ